MAAPYGGPYIISGKAATTQTPKIQYHECPAGHTFENGKYGIIWQSRHQVTHIERNPYRRNLCQ